MQATVNRPVFHINRTTLILAAVVLLGLAITATVAIALNSGAAKTNVSSVHPSATERAPAWRFLEINAMPESPSRPQTNWRFLEINMLPEASLANAVDYEHMRFVEINELPESAELVAPGGSPHSLITS